MCANVIDAGYYPPFPIHLSAIFACYLAVFKCAVPDIKQFYVAIQTCCDVRVFLRVYRASVNIDICNSDYYIELYISPRT